MSNKHEPKEEKEKICFVIMPIADMEGYDSGHFSRVYTHLIQPACKKAGYKAVRADEVASSNYIIIDILHKILDSDMVLCDLSGKNPNVLYELGIRQAFNLPTTLIKDIKTSKIFDIQGLRYTEYNQTLRIDEVVRDTDLIANSIVKTANPDSKDVNSLIQLLAVKPATRPNSVELSSETSVILASINDLGKRMSSLESAQISSQPRMAQSIREHNSSPIYRQKDGSFKINSMKMEIGENVYLDGRDIGILADVTPNEVRIKTQSGNIISMSASDPQFRLLSIVPF